MGVASSSDEASGMAPPSILSKVSVKGGKADMDAFMTEGRVDNVQIGYVTKKQHERFNPRNINRRVVLTHSTIKRVKRNWAMISEGPDAKGGGLNSSVTPLVVLYDTFFGRLFMLDPSMRAMFEDNMIRQSKFLVGLVNIIVKMEDMLKQDLTPVYSFADHSVAMGARPEHYEIIASVLPFALESCAEERAWTNSVAEAWKDVMSFAILAVVERTVESWLGRGTSLSEMWHTLSDWRTHSRNLPSPSSSTPSLPTPERVRVTRNPVATRPSLGSNSSGGLPEAPPRLLYRGAPPDPLQAGRPPGATESRSFSNADNRCSGLTAAATADDGNINIGSPRCDEDGGAAGRRPHHPWARRISALTTSTSTATAALSTAQSADQDLDVACNLNACVLSDGEPDGLSSNNSGDVDVDFDGGAFGSGSGTGVRKGSLKNAVVGVLHVSGGGEGNGSRSRSPPPPQQRKETKFSPSKVSYNRVGRSATDGSVALARSMASIRRPESASLDPSMALDDASRVIDNQERRLSNRSVSVHADHEEYHHLGAIVTGASTTAASRASVAAKGTVVEGAGAGGGGVIGGGAGCVSGGHRSSLNILRRKKITRSASLEEDDEISHRRHSVLSRASQDLKGGRGGGSSSSTRALQDLTVVKESGGMLRGKGRDGSLALTAGYVRSQSVTDELLPADRHDSSRFDRSMTRFDLGGDLPSHLDQHTRRRGLVSRMRRTASNVIRFRSSSRPLESSCDHGREHGHGQSHHTANAQHATHRQNSHGGIGLGVGIGRQNTHQQVRVRSYGSDMGLGADGLRVSSASPASPAVPTPAAATPPLDVNSTVVKKTGSEPSHRAPRDDRCHNGVPRMAGSVEHAWTVSHGNQGYKKPFSPPRPLPGQALTRERASQSGPVLTGFGGFGGEKTAFAYYFSLSESEQEAQRRARQHQQEQHQHQQQQRRQQLEQQQQQRYQQQQRHQQQEQKQRHQQQEQKQRHQQQQQRYQQQEQQQRHQQQGQQQEMQKGMKQGSGEGDRVDGGNGATQRLSSGASVSTLRDRTTERDNPWRQMKLHELMAKLEDSSAGETERNFCDIAEAILCHLGPSEPPTTRALALDVAQTFVQNVLSERSKDRKSSKIRRKAFKEFLMHVVPLVLDCLKSPGGNNLSSRSAENGSTTKGASAETSGEIEPASLPPASASAAAAAAAAGVASAVASTSIGTGTSSGTGKTTGDVVVLHYYQQHHQYVLRVTALETMSRFLTVLRALFRPPHSTRVQKAVAPLLDADEEVLRDRAAAVLGKLSLCGKDSLKWANVAIKVSLEAHNLLHDAWPDESAGQIPSSEVESIMGEHPLLPAIHDTFAKGDPEAHVMALGRRFPALCKLLATLVTVSPPKSNDANMSTEDGVQTKPDEGGESSPTPLAPPPYQIPFLAKLSISLVQRVLRMGGQAWAILEDERTGVRRNDSCSPDGATLVKSSAQHHRGASNDTLTPELAARVSDLLLPSVVNLLDALVSSPKLEHVMEEHQAVVCRCMAQAVAQMPVQGGMRFAAYRSMALVIRYTQPGCAALELGVPMLPLLFNEALLALGNTVSLYPVSHKTVSSVRAVTEELSGISTPEVAFNVRTPVNNGHGVKLHHDTVGAGVECLAELVLISGHFLPPAQIAEVERVVTEGVELLATRPLEVSPFNEDEPQVLRHASTREAFVKLVHFYLVLAEEKGRNPGSTLYSEAKAAFLCHLQDPDGAVARECGRALTALKAEGIDQNGHHDHGDHHGSQRGEDRSVDRRKPHKPNEPHKERPLEDMEAEADKGHHASNAEAGYVLEELDTGEYHVVRCADKVANKRSPARVPKAVL